MLLFRLRTIWKTVNRKFYPTRLIAQTLPLWIPFVPVDAERPHWNTVHIRTGYQKLAWFIRGCQAGAVLLGWNPQIDRKMGKSHSFRWAILWIILLYMFFLNKRSNFEQKPHELSYRSNISCSNSKWQYIFFRKISERYFIVKNNKNFFDPYNVWKNWYPMTHWSYCFYTHESFTLVTYNISFIFTYLLHSGRHSTLHINARVYQQLSAPCLRNWSLSIFL